MVIAYWEYQEIERRRSKENGLIVIEPVGTLVKRRASMYALMAFAVAAVMIIFIASIVAGTILGTFLLVMDLIQRVRGAASARSRAARAPANTPA